MVVKVKVVKLFAGNSSMASVLGNAVLYFSQVVSTVDSSIKELVAPIEKEMKVYLQLFIYRVPRLV